MASHSLPSTDWNGWDDNHYQRDRPALQQQQQQRNHSHLRRPRARSADARPQYKTSNNRLDHLNVFPTHSEYSYDTQFLETPTAYSSNISGVYDVGWDDNRGRSVSPSRQRPNFSASNEIIMVPGDPYNSTVRNTPAYPYGDWGPEQDKYLGQMMTNQPYMSHQQQEIPHISSAASNHQRKDQMPQFRNFQTVEHTNNGSQRRGGRSSIKKSSMLQKLKGVKTIIPSLSKSRSRSSSPSGSRDGYRQRGDSKEQSKIPSKNHNQRAISVSSSRSSSSTSNDYRRNPSNIAPFIKMQQRPDSYGGSFDNNDFDFDGDGFAHQPSKEYDYGPSDGFKVIQPSSQGRSNGRQQQHQSYMGHQNAPKPPNSYSQYMSNNKVPFNPFAKTSPTSVVDINANNVRWSDNLSQSPIGSRKVYRVREPKSILRGSRANRSLSSDDYPSMDESPPRPKKTNDEKRPSHEYISGFVNVSGNSISPIKSATSPEAKAIKRYQDEGVQWPDSNSGFQKHIPEEYQRPFIEKNAAASRKDDSGIISDAYNEFIESVAAVVVQTAIRQFLAMVRVRRIREEVAAARKYRYNRRRIEGQRAPSKDRRTTPRISMQANVNNRRGMATRHENQLFHLAAVRIQSIYRGWWARDSLRVDHYCASVIQKTFRAFRYRNLFLYDMYRVVVAQSVVRRYLVCRAIYGGVQWKHIDQWEVKSHFDLAATVIQSKWRSFSTEMTFLSIYRDILIIQSVVRGWLTRRSIKASLRQNNERHSNRVRSKHSYRRQLAGRKSPASSSRNHDYASTQFQPPSKQQSKPGTKQFDFHQRYSGGFSPRSGTSDIDQRRKTKEVEKQAMFEEDRRRREKEAAQAAEVKAMQRRMGVRTPEGKSANQRFSTASGKEESAGVERLGHQGISLADSFDSDRETEIQSNRSSTLRLLGGWRNRERSTGAERKPFTRNSFGRIKEVESEGDARLHSNFVIHRSAETSRPTEPQVLETKTSSAPLQKPPQPAQRPSVSRSPRKSGISMQDLMRSQRSSSEQNRLNKMHEIFALVGLMAKFEDKGNGVVQERMTDKPVAIKGISFQQRESGSQREPANAKALEVQTQPRQEERKRNSFINDARERFENQGHSQRHSSFGTQRALESSRASQSRGVETDDSVASLHKQPTLPQRPVVSRRSRKSGISMQDMMRSQRSSSEHRRLDKMHETFSSVGLMAKFEDNVKDVVHETKIKPAPSDEMPFLNETKGSFERNARAGQSNVEETKRGSFGFESKASGLNPSRALDTKQSEARRLNSFGNVVEKFQASSVPAPVRVDRKLFLNEQVDSTKANGSNLTKEPSSNEQAGARQRRIMQAFGLDDSYDSDDDSDSSDDEG